MPTTIDDTEIVSERTRRRIARRPITFDDFVDMFTGRDEPVELVNGVVMEKPMIQWDHATLEEWLHRLLGDYVEVRGMGIVVYSRFPVKTHEFGGRLPDLVYISNERMPKVEQKGIYGAPDLIIEVISPGDRRSRIIEIEAEYRTLKVPEICFIDQRKRSIRLLRAIDLGYEEIEIREGSLTFTCLPGLSIETSWLFSKPRPIVPILLREIEASRGSADG